MKSTVSPVEKSVDNVDNSLKTIYILALCYCFSAYAGPVKALKSREREEMVIELKAESCAVDVMSSTKR